MRAILAMAVLIGGCQFIPGTDAAKIAEARKVVSTKLKDGPSARFDEERLLRSGGEEVVCGKVNAKTEFGGYGGFKPYAFNIKTKRSYYWYQPAQTEAELEDVATFPKECLPA